MFFSVSPISPCSDARDGRRRSFFKFSGKMFFPKTRFFPFQYEYSIDFGGKGFSNGPLWPACGPFVAPLWPLVARCGPLVAPCGPFVFYGRTFEKFSRGPLCGPPGHRATRNFSKVRISRFFHFSADGRRYRKRRESIILSFLLLVDRRPKNEKKTKNPNL